MPGLMLAGPLVEALKLMVLDGQRPETVLGIASPDEQVLLSPTTLGKSEELEWDVEGFHMPEGKTTICSPIPRFYSGFREMW